MTLAKSIYPSPHIGPRRASKSTLWRNWRQGLFNRDDGRVEKTVRFRWVFDSQARLDRGSVGLCLAADGFAASDWCGFSLYVKTFRMACFSASLENHLHEDKTMATVTGTQATLYEVRKGAAWITLNRPENRNALSSILVNELYAHLGNANQDPEVRTIVITGNGPAFCAGADLKSPPGQSIDGGGQAVPYPEVLRAILDSDKPVIAAINGAAFAGGLGLVGAADIVITVDDAQFSFSEVRIGVIPAVISVVCLPKLGTHHGMKLLLTGERFNGRQAVEYGLVHRSVPKAQLQAAVQEEIDMINLGGPNAVVECKKLVRRVSQLSTQEGFAETGEWSVRMFKSPEGAEGMAAFREKRKPNWVKED